MFGARGGSVSARRTTRDDTTDLLDLLYSDVPDDGRSASARGTAPSSSLTEQVVQPRPLSAMKRDVTATETTTDCTGVFSSAGMVPPTTDLAERLGEPQSTLVELLGELQSTLAELFGEPQTTNAVSTTGQSGSQSSATWFSFMTYRTRRPSPLWGAPTNLVTPRQ